MLSAIKAISAATIVSLGSSEHHGGPPDKNAASSSASAPLPYEARVLKALSESESRLQRRMEGQEAALAAIQSQLAELTPKLANAARAHGSTDASFNVQKIAARAVQKHAAGTGSSRFPDAAQQASPRQSTMRSTSTTHVHVFQASDKPLNVSHFATWMRTISAFASSRNWTYRHATFKRTRCVFTDKVKAIHRGLSETREGEWLLYIDTDVAAMRCSRPSVFDEKPELLTERSPDGVPCYFIAQDSPKTINSGILLMRQSPEARNLVAMWLERQATYNFCQNSADQFALQSVIVELRTSNGSFNGTRNPFPNGTNASKDYARAPTPPCITHHANGWHYGDSRPMKDCFDRRMRALGAEYGKRSWAGQCLISPSTRRINHKDHAYEFRLGDSFYHGDSPAYAQNESDCVSNK